MEKKLTPELKVLKKDLEFINKKIGELEWERAIRFYGKIAVLSSEVEKIDIQIENYRENKVILIEKIENAVSKQNAVRKLGVTSRKPTEHLGSH